MTKLFSVRFQTDTECLTSDTERDKFHPSTMKRTQSSVAKQQFQGDFPVPGLAPVLWRSQTPLCCLGILLQEFYPEQFSSSDHLILPFLSLCSSSQAALCGCSATRAPPGMHELSLTLTLIPENPVPSLQLPALSLQLGFAGWGSAHGWMSTRCSTLIALEQLGSCRNNFLPSQGWFFIYFFFPGTLPAAISVSKALQRGSNQHQPQPLLLQLPQGEHFKASKGFQPVQLLLSHN